MLTSHAQEGRQLLCFAVHGLPDWDCAVTLHETVEVTNLSSMIQIPFASSFVLGITRWRGNLVPVVDMAAALRQVHANRLALGTNTHYVIGQFVRGTQVCRVAWPTLSLKISTLPYMVPLVMDESVLNSNLSRLSLQLDDRRILLLNLEGLSSRDLHLAPTLSLDAAV